MYFAIIGDIIASKTISNRSEVQNHLKRILDQVNEEYKSNIASRFSITLGDEFQGLLHSAAHLFELLDTIQFQLYPTKIRFGIGVGDMNTEIIQETSMGSDGPAYWSARNAIEKIHEKNDYGNAKVCLQKYSASIEEEVLLDAANKTLKLCDRYANSWTKSQYEFVRRIILTYRYGDNGEYNQRELAQELDISPQLVNSKVKNTGFSVYVNTKCGLENVLKEKWG